MVCLREKFDIIASHDIVVLSTLVDMSWTASLQQLKTMQSRVKACDDTKEEYLPSPRKRRRLSSTPPKRVVFAEERNSINYHEYTAGDRSNSWLQDQEYKSIREESKATILAIKCATCSLTELDASQICLRGLEEQVSIVIFRACRNRQRRFIDRILKRQFVLRKMGLSDPDVIGSLSFEMSKNDRIRALKAASIDACC